MREVVIASAVRTAIGSFGGTLKDISAVELGSIVIKEALKRANINPNMVDEGIIGNVLQAGQGQNPARQTMVKAGIPVEVPAMTINMLCGSGLKSVGLAYQIIKAGEADIIVAGGIENMSQAPYLVTNARWGKKMGNQVLVDDLMNDGLMDAFNQYPMGITAENVAEKWGITREEQDKFALLSQQKAKSAIEAEKFKDEIIPVTIKTKKGEIIFDHDEFPRFNTTIEALSKLKPAFKKGGTVTAGNSSGINDCGAALIIMSSEKAAELGVKPMAKITSFGQAGLDPAIMGYGPFYATNKALKKADLSIEDMDLIELNEAFAAQSIAVSRDLNLNMDKVNVNGGAIALGHPIGASGARILVSLLYEMARRDCMKGLATLCIGGGMGAAMIVER